MRKILILLVLTLTAGLIACGGSDSKDRVWYVGGALSPTGVVGSTYSGSVATATLNGAQSENITYTLVGSLPEGLSFSAGAISGTPAAGTQGTHEFAVTASASGFKTTEALWTIVINVPATPVITYTGAALPGGGYNQPYSGTVGTASVVPAGTITYAGTGLPAGLELNPQTGAITGSTSATGSFTISVTASSTGAQSVTEDWTLDIAAPAIVYNGGQFSATQGASVTGSVAGAVVVLNGFPGYTATVTYEGNNVPAGVSVGGTGAVSGTAPTTGNYQFSVTASSPGAQAVNRDWTLNVFAPSTPAIIYSGGSLANGLFNQAGYSATVGTASGLNLGTTAITYAVASGSTLPAGLSLNETTGAITGQPAASGSFGFSITASAGSATPVTVGWTISITAPVITYAASQQLADGAFNQLYTAAENTVGTASVALAGVPGYAGTVAYALVAGQGALPGGLSLNATTGAITGTPNAAAAATGNFTFSISATSAGAASVTAVWTITIASPVITYTASSLTATVGTAYSGSVGGATVSLEGFPTYTAAITYSLASGSAMPAGLGLAATGDVFGTPLTAGEFEFSITASFTGAPTNVPVTREWTMTISGSSLPTMDGTGETLPSGTVGIVYGGATVQSSGSGDYVAAGLPAGLTMTTGGVISGTPTAAGMYRTFTVTRGTGAGAVVSTWMISIYDKPVIFYAASGTLTAAAAGVEITRTVGTAVGTTGITYAVKTADLEENQDDSLPVGLTLASNGSISGTAAAGTENANVRLWRFVIIASAPNAEPKESVWTITINAPVAPPLPSLTFEGTTLPSGAIHAEYAGTVIPAATGAGNPDITYAITSTGANALFPGLEFDAETRAISGTPTASGTRNIVVTATAEDFAATPATFPMTIAAAGELNVITYTGSTLTALTVGTAIAEAGVSLATATLVTTGFDTPPAITYAVATGANNALPAGLTLSTAGILSGTPTAAMAGHTFVVNASAIGVPTVSATFTVTVNETGLTALTFSGSSLTAGLFGKAGYSATVSATGTTGITYALRGGNSLPGGLALNAATGAITGTPTAAGTFNFAIIASAADAQSVQAAFSIVVAPIMVSYTYANTSLSSATGAADAILVEEGNVGVAYTGANVGGASFTTVAADIPLGMTIQYALATGSTLPAGLALNPLTGAITGSFNAPSDERIITIRVSTAGTNQPELEFTLEEIALATSGQAEAVNEPIFGTDLPDGQEGAVYSSSVRNLNEGRGVHTGGLHGVGFTYTLDLQAGETFPDGLYLRPHGEIEGIPALGSADSYEFTVSATAPTLDGAVVETFTLEINSAPSLPPIANACDNEYGSGLNSLYCNEGDLVQPDIVMAQDVVIMDLGAGGAAAGHNNIQPTVDRPLVVRITGGDRVTDENSPYYGVPAISALNQKPMLQEKGTIVAWCEDSNQYFTFKDLSGDGQLDIYEDWRRDPFTRAMDLAQRLTPQMLSGMLFNNGGSISTFPWAQVTAQSTPVRSYVETGISSFTRANVNPVSGTAANGQADRQTMRNGILANNADGRQLLVTNGWQAVVEQLPWGVPIAFVTDPATGWGTNMDGTGFGRIQGVATNNYPWQLGYGAIGCMDYAFEHGLLHGLEYRLGGHEIIYGVTIDSSSGQKWSRLYDGFGSEYKMMGEMGTAYFRGMQNIKHGLEGVALTIGVIKHVPGSGNNAGGMDSHRVYGRWHTQYPGHINDAAPMTIDNLRDGRTAGGDATWPYYKAMVDDVIRPVLQRAYPLGIMPCYGIYADQFQHTTYTASGDSTGPLGTRSFSEPGTIIRPNYETGGTYDYDLMIRLLREDIGWDAGIYTDWGVTLEQGYGLMTEQMRAPYHPVNNPYGTGLGTAFTAANRSDALANRAALTKTHVMGQATWDWWLGAYNRGSISLEYLQYAGAKHLECMIRLGMLENPYKKMEDWIYSREAGAAGGDDAGRRAIVLLKNDDGEAAVLPLNAAPGGNVRDKIIFWDGVTSRGNAAATTGLFTPYGVQASNMVAEAARNTADIQIIRVTARRAQYDGMNSGGVPVTFNCPVYQYNRYYLGHQSWLDYMQLAKNAVPGGVVRWGTYGTNQSSLEAFSNVNIPAQGFSETTRLSAALPNASVNLLFNIGSTYRAASSPAQTRGQATKLFNAIANKKEGSKLIVIVHGTRPWTFDSRFTGEVLSGADAGKGIQPIDRPAGYPSHIREVSTIKSIVGRQWTNATTYNGTNLYVPATDNANLPVAATDTLTGAITGFLKPTKLVELIEVGGFTRITENDNKIPIGRVLYVDPVALEAALNANDTLKDDPAEIAALRSLKWVEFNPGRMLTTWPTVVTTGAVLAETQFIDNPVDYIDGFLADFGGLPDASLISALFGRNGSATAAPFAPRGTLPFGMYHTNTQEEHTWEDIPDDLPGVTHVGKRGYLDYHGFLFGYRAGLTNHPTLPSSGPATRWERGTALGRDGITLPKWKWAEPTYPMYDGLTTWRD